jgi:NADH:ubiquinone oxidoreductase subunit E
MSEHPEHEEKNSSGSKVRVCVHKTCRMRGSERIYERLRRDLAGEAEVESTYDCFRFCKSGPNVAVNGNVLKGIRPDDAADRVRRELLQPSRRLDGIGTRSLDELDDVLDELFP